MSVSLGRVNEPLLSDLGLQLSFELQVDLASFGVSAQGAAEKQHVRLGSVHVVVDPAPALRDAQSPPLFLSEQSLRLDLLAQVSRQHDVAVLVVFVAVPLGVLDALAHLN